MQNKWLEWAQRIKALSQIGKTYTKDPYDLERYNQLEALVHEIFAKAGEKDITEVRDLLAGLLSVPAVCNEKRSIGGDQGHRVRPGEAKQIPKVYEGGD